MEHCDAGDLFQYILQCVREQRRKKRMLASYLETASSPGVDVPVKFMGPAAESELVYLVRTILQPLVYLHSKRCAHRDVKAQNFLFSSQPSPHSNTASTVLGSSVPCTPPRVPASSFSAPPSDLGSTPVATDSASSPAVLKTPPCLQNRRLVLIDFGMSSFVPDGGQLKTLCGSPHYVAPEILSYVSRENQWTGADTYMVSR